jgi:hypothetical protein
MCLVQIQKENIRKFSYFYVILFTEILIFGTYCNPISFIRKTPAEPEETKTLSKILEFLWTKIEEKFSKIADAFRFFDIESNTAINK